MTADDANLAAIDKLRAELDPRAFRLRVREYRRGGLPASSVPEAISRTSEPPLPMLEGYDRQLLERERQYSRHLRDAYEELRSAWAIQNSILIASEAVPDEPVRFCSTCSEPFSDKDAQGAAECARCRQHRRRHGEAWPNVRTDGKKEPAA